MKKLRIMLLSLALFAVVGGALAFKAKFDVNYCTSFFPGGSLTCGDVTCPDYIAQQTTAGGTTDWLCTVIAPNTNCTKNSAGDKVDCAAVASTKIKTDQ